LASHDARRAGFFRTELLSKDSTSYAAFSIEDYAERTAQTVTAWNAMNGRQSGDPAKLAQALVELASQDEPPLRFATGADAVQVVEQKAKDLLAQADAHRELSSSLTHDDAAWSRPSGRRVVDIVNISSIADESPGAEGLLRTSSSSA
jgi:hypothetical protein